MSEMRPGALAGAATRGAAVLSGTNFAGYGLSFLSTLVLARLLTPADFGEVAFAVAIADVVMLTANWSLPLALIREPEESAHAMFNAAIFLSAALCAGALAISAGVAIILAVVAQPGVWQLFLALVAGRVASLFGMCFSAERDRWFAYRDIAVVQLGSVTLAIGLSLPLGFAGAGVWALAARDIGVNFFILVLAVVVSRWRPTWSSDRAKIRELARFGWQMTRSRLGEMLFHRYDNIVVGAIAGTAQLGLYNQAYVLAETSNKIFVPMLQQVPFATYARLRDDQERLSRAFGLVTFVIVRVVVPMAVLILVLPDDLVTSLLGSQWRPAADILRILSAYALLLPLFEHLRVLLVATGNVGAMLRARAIQLALFLPSVLVGVVLAGGLGAAMAVALAMVVGTIAIGRAASTVVEIRVRDYLPAIFSGSVAMAVGLAVRYAFAPGYVRLVVATACILGSYVGATMLLEGAKTRAVLALLLHAARSRPGSVSESPGTWPPNDVSGR
jgi:PST family polysaccharide transporter